jgi:hypothetical protein
MTETIVVPEVVSEVDGYYEVDWTELFKDNSCEFITQAGHEIEMYVSGEGKLMIGIKVKK